MTEINSKVERIVRAQCNDIETSAADVPEMLRTTLEPVLFDNFVAEKKQELFDARRREILSYIDDAIKTFEQTVRNHDESTGERYSELETLQKKQVNIGKKLGTTDAAGQQKLRGELDSALADIDRKHFQIERTNQTIRATQKRLERTLALREMFCE